MKHLLVVVACAALCVVSCKKKAEPEPDPASTTTTTGNPVGTTTAASVNTGPLSLYLVDSTKLKAITETGVESLLLNAGNSYISFSPSVNNTKLVYYAFREIYMADPNGSNIQQVCPTLAQPAQFEGIRAGLNHKIYYIFEQNNTHNLYSVNTDGTGTTVLFSNNAPFREIAPDGAHVAYLLWDTLAVMNTSGPVVTHKIPLGSSTGVYSDNTDFSYNGQKVIASSGNGDTLKLKMFDIATSTALTHTVTLIPNNSGSSINYYAAAVHMASDGDRVVITVRQYPNTICYIYRISTGTVLTSFVVNNVGINEIYAF